MGTTIQESAAIAEGLDDHEDDQSLPLDLIRTDLKLGESVSDDQVRELQGNLRRSTERILSEEAEGTETGLSVDDLDEGERAMFDALTEGFRRVFIDDIYDEHNGYIGGTNSQHEAAIQVIAAGEPDMASDIWIGVGGSWGEESGFDTNLHPELTDRQTDMLTLAVRQAGSDLIRSKVLDSAVGDLIPDEVAPEVVEQNN